jgi:protease-4
VEPQVFSRGAYKSAGELLVRDQMSEPQREQTERILDAFHHALLDALAERPAIGRDRAQAIVDGGPYTGEEAVRAGLADAAAHDDEVADKLGDGQRAKVIPLGAYLERRRALQLPRVLPKPVVGVVRVHGAIVVSGPGFAARAAEEPLVSAIRMARRSRRVRGVLLHVDSPGGSALASDRIHHELEQLAKEKPVVAYLSDVAASGGYYLAAAAHQIVAQPTSITGSIGVVAARFSAEALLAKLGIRSSTVQRGARAHLVDPLAPLSESDRGAIERELDAVYRAFLDVVARGRKRPVDEVRAVAEGRVWVGADAKEKGLVDTLGDFHTALDAVRARIGPNAAALEPAVIQGGKHAGPPLAPPSPKALLLDAIAELSGVPLSADGRERVLAFSELAALLGTV